MESILFGGDGDIANATFLGDAEYGVEIDNEPAFPAGPTKAVNIQETPYGPGTSHGKYDRMRTHIVGVRIIGNPNKTSDLETKIDALNALFETTRAQAFRRTDFYPNRYWEVEYVGGLEAAIFAGHIARCTLTFVAPDSRAFHVNETALSFTLTGTSDTFAVPAPEGNTEAQPVFIIKDPTGGATLPILTNTTRSEIMSYNSSVGDTEWLRIDSDLRRKAVEKSTDDGITWSRSMFLLSGHKFPQLTPGVINNFSLSGMTNGCEMDVTYRARFK